MNTDFETQITQIKDFQSLAHSKTLPSILGQTNVKPSPSSSESLYEALSQYYLKDAIDEVQWDDLVKSYTNDKNKNFPKARHLVLESHLEFDRLFTYLILFTLLLGVRELGCKDFDFKKQMLALFKVTFARRLEIVRSLGVLKGDSLRVISAVNDMRNEFTHPIKKKNNMFIYSGKSIFTISGIKELIKDCEKVKEEIDKLLEKL